MWYNGNIWASSIFLQKNRHVLKINIDKLNEIIYNIGDEIYLEAMYEHIRTDKDFMCAL